MRLVRRLSADARGATVSEFAIILVPLCVLLLGLSDMAFTTYVQGVLQGALQEAARKGTIGDSTSATLTTLVKQRLGPLVKANYITVTDKSYVTFAQVKKPEKLITDVNGNGNYDTGDCYEDANGNSVYDADGGKTGLGGADAILYYEVKASYPRLFPMAKLLGWSATSTVSSSTTLRNQPYASQAVPGTVCN